MQTWQNVSFLKEIYLKSVIIFLHVNYIPKCVHVSFCSFCRNFRMHQKWNRWLRHYYRCHDFNQTYFMCYVKWQWSLVIMILWNFSATSGFQWFRYLIQVFEPLSEPNRNSMQHHFKHHHRHLLCNNSFVYRTAASGASTSWSRGYKDVWFTAMHWVMFFYTNLKHREFFENAMKDPFNQK